MSNIIIGHGKNRNLCYRSGAALNDSCALIKRCKLAVQITRISFTGRDLAFGGRNLSHCLTERGNVSKDDQNVHSFFKGKVFGCRKSDLRCQKTLYYRIVCQIRNMTTWSEAPLSSKVRRKNSATSYFYAHCCKYNGKVFIGVASQEKPAVRSAQQVCRGGSPFPEKIGSFCPRISVVRPSIAEIPVLI